MTALLIAVEVSPGTNWDKWVAIGTLLLAVGTAALAVVTFFMARRAKESVEVQEKHLIAIQRPYVYPLVPDWDGNLDQKWWWLPNQEWRSGTRF